MSELDDALLQHIKYLVNEEKRPFCYKDMLWFEVQGKEYRMNYGTARNKLCQLRKSGIVEVLFYDVVAFYTLKGIRFQKKRKIMTPYRTGVHEVTFRRILENLPLGKRSIHNIRLKFKVSNIWSLLSKRTEFRMVKISKDVKIEPWMDDNVIVSFTVHKTDTVTVIVSCSLYPIPLDVDGIIRFFNVLVRAEERLKNTLKIRDIELSSEVPSYKNWIVTMWHFGRDSLTEYNGETFSITVEKAHGILLRMYSKEITKWSKKVRLECQEYPRKSIEEAIADKLFLIDK